MIKLNVFRVGNLRFVTNLYSTVGPGENGGQICVSTADVRYT